MIQEIYISHQEKLSITNHLKSVSSRFNTDEHDLYDVFSKTGNQILQSSLNQSNFNDIKLLANNIYNAPTFIIRGMPLPLELPTTPTKNGHINDGLIYQPLTLLFGLYSMCNVHPVAYSGENKDRIIRHVIPNEQSKDEVSSHGSEFEFGMHVDNPHLPLDCENIVNISGCPQFLALHCLKTDTSVPTELIFLDDILENMPEFIIDGLKKQNYRILKPDSFGENQEYIESLSILGESSDGYMLNRFDSKFATAKNKEATFCLSAFFNEVKNANSNKIILTPGDILILHNQRTLHARGAFKARFNGSDRWLLRLYGTKQINRHILIENKPKYLGKA